MAIPTLGTATTGTTASVTSFAVDLPTHSEGDLLLMFVQEGSGRTITVSTWTTVATRAATGSGSLGVYAKVAGASEGSTKTVSLDNSAACSYACVAVSGAADIGVTPIVAGTDGSATAANIVAPGITATDDDSLIIIGGADGGGSGFSGTLADYTLIANLQNGTSFDDFVIFARDAAAAAGAVASKQIATNSTYAWLAFTLAIAPTSGGASAIPAFIHHRKLLGVQ